MNPEFEKLGATLVAVSPELQVESRKIHRGSKLNFDILFDKGNALADQFRITHGLPDALKELYKGFGIDLESTQGNADWRLPMPGRYIVSQEGLVVYAERDPDYTVRPEPEHTLEALKAL